MQPYDYEHNRPMSRRQVKRAWRKADRRARTRWARFLSPVILGAIFAIWAGPAPLLAGLLLGLWLCRRPAEPTRD
jgi:hypothetical protein